MKETRCMTHKEMITFSVNEFYKSIKSPYYVLSFIPILKLFFNQFPFSPCIDTDFDFKLIKKKYKNRF